ncbi:MAG: hypothetical protein NZ918_05240 [Aigarchaeota archaeon]|nr:hypothetical protein [Aigarchaeota archaeon]MDW8021968.1 hypothetical protein [Nitrososphaerota archaeon]
MERSKSGLSPLLAILIGLVITIVAGILLAQLYFSYAATISTRPAANVEYIDLVYRGDGSGILVVNVKNMGNIRINNLEIKDGKISCEDIRGVPTPSGGVASMACTVGGISLGGNVVATLIVTFEDGSSQAYPIAARARAP